MDWVRSAVHVLQRQRLKAMINIGGLSISLACCVLLLLFVRDEVSFDRHHANYNRICRILRETQPSGHDAFITQGTSGGTALALQREFSEDERATRMLIAWGWLENPDTQVGFSRLFAIADPQF